MLQVRAAQHLDIQGVIKVCEENLLSNHQKIISGKEIVSRGFLMSKLEYEQAKNMIDDKKNFIFLIAEDRGEVLGYLTACDIAKVEEEFQKEIIESKNKKIIYYKQIAKKPGYKGVGKDLLFAFFNEAKSKNYDLVICKIVHEPFYNQASIDFHQKYGFKEIRKIPEKNRVVGVYMREIS